MAAVAGATVLCSAALTAATGTAQAEVSVAGTWQRAIEVPGTGALNTGGGAGVSAVSCVSAGNCLVGGSYTDGAGHCQVFVASERNGTWGTAIELPGLAALNTGGGAEIESVSCASPGNCAAGGYYELASSLPGSRPEQAFVASEQNGTWGNAIEVPGTAPPASGGGSRVLSVSCGSAGNCAAGGYYPDSSGAWQAFVDSEQNGTWETAISVPGIGALATGQFAEVNSVSCASAGNCLAGGQDLRRSGGPQAYQAFVSSEQNGSWHTAIVVPGSAALAHRGRIAGVTSVSCAEAGSCLVGGYYAAGYQRGYQVFVASERHGSWQRAIELPGIFKLNKGGFAGVPTSVSCASPRNCAAGGSYRNGTGPLRRVGEAFVASEQNGRWGTAIEVPGTGALNKRGNASVTSVSCFSAGNCLVGGYYLDSSRHDHTFVASERNGIWRTAIEVPGIGALDNGGNDYVSSVSCAPAGYCLVGGYYTDGSLHDQAFVASKT
jgi:hypothetical protein